MKKNGASKGFARRGFAGRDFTSGTGGELDRDRGAGDGARSGSGSGAGNGAKSGVKSGGDASSECGGCASRAQHFHDLALEFLVMMRFTAAARVRERYRMMGQHYLARAGKELARAVEDQPPSGRRKKRRRAARKVAAGWATAAEAFQLDRRVVAKAG